MRVKNLNAVAAEPKILALPPTPSRSGFPPPPCRQRPGPPSGPADTPAPAERLRPVRLGRLRRVSPVQRRVSPVQCPSCRCTTCPDRSGSVSAAQGPALRPAPSGGGSSAPPSYSPETTTNARTHARTSPRALKAFQTNIFCWSNEDGVKSNRIKSGSFLVHPPVLIATETQ